MIIEEPQIRSMLHAGGFHTEATVPYLKWSHKISDLTVVRRSFRARLNDLKSLANPIQSVERVEELVKSLMAAGDTAHLTIIQVETDKSRLAIFCDVQTKELFGILELFQVPDPFA